ncbi:MAG: DUF1232 domain-containing protein [Desulfobulbaceae bacterium]|nr:DUF1232 domain-containing protein [Desulfobulbaceae bacterium]
MVRHTKKIFLARTTPRYVKVILGLGLLYCISPLDFIPEWVPVLGLMDDLALAAMLIAWANSFDAPEDEESRREGHAGAHQA